MSDLLTTIGSELSDMLSFFVTIALLQNIVLTTGLGSSMMMHIVRKPKNIWLFSGLLLNFTVLTVVIAYPLDNYFGTAITNFWRPLMLTGITIVLYIIAALVIQGFFPKFHARVNRLLPLAAFNTLVSGLALVSNVQFSSNLGGIIGLAIGSCLGFAILTWLIAEGIERMDNPDMPASFRGMPSILVYIGILALALLGFKSTFTLI